MAERQGQYIGVRMRKWGSWISEIREPNNKKRLWLGTFPSAEIAALAHDIAELGFKGKYAALNFEESKQIQIPNTLSVQAIRAAAFAVADNLLTEKREAEARGESEARSGSESEGEGEGGCEALFEMQWHEPDIEIQAPLPDHSYIDEELLFEMPSILCNMAHALLLPPPCFLDSHLHDDYLVSEEISLW